MLYNGMPRSIKEAAAKLRNVTFVGYSAGSIVAQETFNATLKMMKQTGWEEKAARQVLKEVVLLAVGCISRPSKEIDRFSTVYLVASNDRINRIKNWMWGAIGTARRTLFTDYAWRKNKKGLSVRPLSNSSLFVQTAARPTLYEWKYDEAGNRTEKKKIDPLYPSWTMRRSYHELPHYLTIDDNNNGFARMALYVMLNALKRTGTPDTMALLKPPADDVFSVADQAEYSARLKSALKPMPAALVKK